MTLDAPTEDFTEILDDIGQSVTIRSKSRTVSDGAVTAVTNTDLTTTAVVQEVSYKEKIFLQMGVVEIGDIMFFFGPSTVITQYDQIIWNATLYRVRKILMPPRIDGTLLYKQVLTVRDNTNI